MDEFFLRISESDRTLRKQQNGSKLPVPGCFTRANRKKCQLEASFETFIAIDVLDLCVGACSACSSFLGHYKPKRGSDDRHRSFPGGFWNVTSTPSHPRATAAPLSTLFTILVKPTMHAGNSPEKISEQITRYTLPETANTHEKWWFGEYSAYFQVRTVVLGRVIWVILAYKII